MNQAAGPRVQGCICPTKKTGNQFNDIHDYSGSQITQGYL
jgi:hypothetical protein